MKWKHKDVIKKINYNELKIGSPSLRIADSHLGQINYRSVLARNQGLFTFGVGIPGKTYITRYQVEKFDSETLFYNTIKFVLNLESYEVEDRENKISEMVFI